MIIKVLTDIAYEGFYFSEKIILEEEIKDGDITTESFPYFSFENSMRTHTCFVSLLDPYFLE